VATELRKLDETDHLGVDFSHRRCEDWLHSVQDLTDENGGSYLPAMLGTAAEDWLERYPTHVRNGLLRRATEVHVPLS